MTLPPLKSVTVILMRAFSPLRGLHCASEADTVTTSPVLAREGVAENLGGKHGGSPREEELQPATAAAGSTAIKLIVKDDRPWMFAAIPGACLSLLFAEKYPNAGG